MCGGGAAALESRATRKEEARVFFSRSFEQHNTRRKNRTFFARPTPRMSLSLSFEDSLPAASAANIERDLERLHVDRFRSRRHFFAAAPSEETKSTRVFRESIPQNPLSYSARASLSACSASSMSPAIFFRSNGESYFFRGTPFAPTKNLT